MVNTRNLVVGFFFASSLALTPVAASAAPGESATAAGAAKATVVNPTGVIKVRDLRFGAFVSPIAASTIRIDPDGTLAPGGDVANTVDIAQPPSGRGPARFTITGEGQRKFLVFLPNSIRISNGTSTMTVRRFRFTTRRNNPVTDPRATYDLDVGATLDVAANQQAGVYTGTFDVTVNYN